LTFRNFSLKFAVSRDNVLLAFSQILHVKSRHALISTKTVPNGATVVTVIFIPITCTRNARSAVKPATQVHVNVVRWSYSLEQCCGNFSLARIFQVNSPYKCIYPCYFFIVWLFHLTKSLFSKRSVFENFRKSNFTFTNFKLIVPKLARVTFPPILHNGFIGKSLFHSFNRPFPSYFVPLFQSDSAWKTNWRLVLSPRQKATREWPINTEQLSFFFLRF